MSVYHYTRRCLFLRGVPWLIILVAAGCGAPEGGIVVGSAHLEAIVRDLSGDEARIENLIPPAACPGHCDMRPSDVEAVAGCETLMIHAWQQAMANVQGVIEASAIGEDRIRVVNVAGNWMAPPVQAAAVKAVSGILSEFDSGKAAAYEERAERRAEGVLAVGEGLAERLRQADAASVKVLCNEIQAGFVKWAGFDVVGTFGRPEDLSVADVEAYIRTARDGGVVVVVDNLQSGETKTSEAIANELGAVRVILSNFPGGFEGTETWEKAAERNVELLLEAIAEAKA